MGMTSFEFLVLCNETLELCPVHLFSSFDVIAFCHFLLEFIHHFQQFLCLAAAHTIHISIDPLTSCVAEESLRKVLLNTVSSFLVALPLILMEVMSQKESTKRKTK